MTGGNMKEKTLTQTRQLRGLMREAAEKLAGCGIEEAPLDASLLLEYAAGVTAQDYLMDPFRELPQEKVCSLLGGGGKAGHADPSPAHYRRAGVYGTIPSGSMSMC